MKILFFTNTYLYVYELFNKRSEFIVLFSFINSYFLEVQKHYDASEYENIKEVTKSFIEKYRYYRENKKNKPAELMMNDMKLKSKNILLHSNSSSIHDVFRILKDKEIFPKIYQTVSTPAEEGKIQAKLLSDMGFDVILISENAVGNFVYDIDLALMGSDGIFNDFFINKAGTYPISLLFEQHGKSFFVLADSRKVINQNKIPAALLKKLTDEYEKDPNELWEAAPESINIKNYYFEKTPNKLVTSFYLESGKYSSGNILQSVSDFELSVLLRINET